MQSSALHCLKISSVCSLSHILFAIANTLVECEVGLSHIFFAVANIIAPTKCLIVQESLYAVWQCSDLDSLLAVPSNIQQFECDWLVSSVHDYHHHLLAGSEESNCLQ